MVFVGIACLVLGMIRPCRDNSHHQRIATSSFTLVSLGYCICSIALAYWWVDVKQHRDHLKFFITIVGMNSIFIYVFFEIVGSRWFNGYIRQNSNGIMSWFGSGEMLQFVISSALCIFTLEWLLCYFSLSEERYYFNKFFKHLFVVRNKITSNID
jgi:predicted acyltransferase